jgi:alkylation response protein AidB-like acyl-CoA dehydrogenase
MSGFGAQTEEILFTINRVADASSLPDWDPDLAAEVLWQFARFAESEIAPLNGPGDEQGCAMAGDRVHMPTGFRSAYRKYAEQGWPGLALPQRWGGQEMPAVLEGGVTELFAAANHAFQMVCGLVGPAARSLMASGTDTQLNAYMPLLTSGEWLATMCLSEAGAGSDLGRIRTRAVRDGSDWRITGEKIFVSGGDQDMSEGILHLVLARTDDERSGSRGLSLFLCPSVHGMDRRNAIRVVRIEEKMGIHASPTCQLSFDGARAELIGNRNEGLGAIFPMMNHARVDVALQGIAHAAQAASIAQEYARERRQGRLPGEEQDVTIDEHGDVRRMLDEQQALVATGRTLCYCALVALDQGDNPNLVDFLTPVCKYFGSNSGIQAAQLGIQVLGGYGYLREYRVEQILRDARITALYEGTNGIQAMTLAGRLLRNRGGAAASAFGAWIGMLRKRASGEIAGALGDVSALWAEALRKVGALKDPGSVASAFMELTVCLARLGAWQLMLAQSDAEGFPRRLADLAGSDVIRLRHAARYWSGLIG